MIAAVIILFTVSAVMLFILIIRGREARQLAEQIKRIRSVSTNELIHSEYGMMPTKLIGEINELLKEMRRYEADYQKRKHDLEQMTTNISHDLRTPLTSAMGYLGLIRSSSVSEEEKSKELEIIEKRLIRLEELLNSFFEFSKVISEGKAPELERINLVAVLEEAIVHYYDDYCGQSRAIRLECEENRICLNSNHNMLVRIFDNLINNALKHGCGDLIISVSESGKNGAEIHFENGTKDHDIDASRVFDEFYTTDISRTKGNTGLGLAIAKQFTELLGGKIHAECEKEQFTIIIIFN
jgi:sensor histidine kinase/response regulator